jgi:paraquat-inducible protein B
MSESAPNESKTENGGLKAARRTAGERTTARAATEHSWWPGWIWAVPLAALAIGAWLLVRFLTQGGADVTITFDNAYGVSAGNTDIVYRGAKVGSVSGVTLDKTGSAVKVSATIKQEAKQFLKSGTLFYLSGAQPSLSNLSSLGSILSGPKIEMEPGGGRETKEFHGLERKPEIPRNHGMPVLFSVLFDGSVGGLKAGDAIKLRGFPLGEVRSTAFHYNVAGGKITTPVTIALYPRLFHMEGSAGPNDEEALRGVVNHLVAEGLRANLERGPPLIGSYRARNGPGRA